MGAFNPRFETVNPRRPTLLTSGCSFSANRRNARFTSSVQGLTLVH